MEIVSDMEIVPSPEVVVVGSLVLVILGILLIANSGFGRRAGAIRFKSSSGRRCQRCDGTEAIKLK